MRDNYIFLFSTDFLSWKVNFIYTLDKRQILKYNFITY